MLAIGCGCSCLSLFCCALLCVLSSFTIILLLLSYGCLVTVNVLVALLCLSSWSLENAVWLFLTVPWVGLRCVVVVFPDHTHLLFKVSKGAKIRNREVSPFPAGDHKAQINRRAQRQSKHKTSKKKKIHKRSTALKQPGKYFTGGLKPVSRRQPRP